MASFHEARRLSVLMLGLAVLTGTLVLAGFAACLACDFDSCCDEGDHESEMLCSCACAIQWVAPSPVTLSAGAQVAGSAIPECAPASVAAPPSDLYRPPRA